MIINEKALVREMKEAYKRYGYTVAVDSDDYWTISGGNWAVQIDGQNNVPNQILSLIVLHMGCLPYAGSAAYRIYKTKDGPQVQDAIPGVELEHIRKLQSLIHMPERKPQYINATNLWLSQYRVWQQPENLQIVLVEPQSESLIATKKYVELVSGVLFKSGEISSVYIWPYKDEDEKAHIQHLEGMQWV